MFEWQKRHAPRRVEAVALSDAHALLRPAHSRNCTLGQKRHLDISATMGFSLRCHMCARTPHGCEQAKSRAVKSYPGCSKGDVHCAHASFGASEQLCCCSIKALLSAGCVYVNIYTTNSFAIENSRIGRRHLCSLCYTLEAFCELLTQQGGALWALK